MEVGHKSSYIALPTQPAEFKNLGGNEAPQNMQPSVIGHKDLNRRPHKRSQSQAEKALLEYVCMYVCIFFVRGAVRPQKSPEGAQDVLSYGSLPMI
jgi:hypothetical protein